jgi:hypothetical protein
MSDFNTRGKLPFTVVSSSVNTGYAAALTASVRYNIDIVNKHKDEYGQIKDAPAQGPFTNEHVGGNQHRHTPLNTGNDNRNNRAEAYSISSSAGNIRIYGPDLNGLDKPRAILTRDNTAKSPVNIKNIQTSGNIAGNFENNYQVIQSVGRRTSNNLINDDFIASGALTTQFITGAHNYTLPDIKNNSKSIFVQRFNAPGGKEVSSRGALDREGEEFSPNNSLVTRNINVRQPYYNQLTQHAAQFNSGSTNRLLPDVGTTDAVTIHGVNRNTIQKNLVVDRVLKQSAILSGSLAGSNDEFGGSIAINSNGNIIVVGAEDDERSGGSSTEGLAYIFTNGPNGWIQQHVLSGSLATGSSDNFGTSVAINSIGDRIVVGAWTDERISQTTGHNEGLAYIFVSGSNGWIEQHILSGSLATGSSDQFGNSVAINSIGDRIVVGAQNDESSGGASGEGVAYIFVSGTSGWTQQHILSGSLATSSFDNFGSSVAINSFGDRVVVGSFRDERSSQSSGQDEGLAYIFVSGSNGWTEQHILSGSLATGSVDYFGHSVAINSLGDLVVVGAYQDERSSQSTGYNEGLAYIFVSGSNGWIEQHILSGSLATGSNDYFGYSVAINSLGDLVVVGAYQDERSSQSTGYNEGLAYEFVSGSNGWELRHIWSGSLAIDSNDNFGISVALNSTGNVIAIGAYQDEKSGATFEGLAYVFERNDGYTEDLTTYDNFWVQHAIPSTDLRYKWIADSITSDQQPIQYQSYNLPYSTGNTYNSNDAYNDLSISPVNPFGDHLGISGAIDKDEVFSSIYTNTMYRDRKYLFFTASNDCFINASSIAQEISEKDFSISFWASFPSSASNGEKTLLVYSGSSRLNELVMNVSSSLCGLTISGSQITTEYQLSSSLLDSSWHLITLTNDVTSTTRRITTVIGSTIETTSYPTVTRIYVDGGLVSQVLQPNKIFNLSQITLSIGRGSELQGGRLDEIYLWDKVLTEQEISEIYRTTKSDYGKQPKKYVEHNLNNSNIPTPTHGYSSDIEKNTNILLDLVGSKNLTINNFTSSVNIQPQNSGLLSYSTYFNGPYGGASWKSIRNAEHPVTRKLTTENTNIVSVKIPEGPRSVTRNVGGTSVIIQLPGSRKQGKLLNVKESPVYINNKPLKHRFILKDSTDPNIAIETTHTYGNNLQYFANQELNDTLGLLKTDRQMYDVLYDYYSGEAEEDENPIEKLVGYAYSETIFPKPGTSLLKETRQRTDYITDEPGFGIDGYDRQLGTQRVFWRDSQDDRMRTRRNYITSLGDQVQSVYDLPFQTPSVAALEYISQSNKIQVIDEELNISNIRQISSIIDYSFVNSGELNQYFCFVNVVAKSSSLTGDFGQPTEYTYTSTPASMVMEYYISGVYGSYFNKNIISSSGLYPLFKFDDPSSYRILPKFVYEHQTIIYSGSNQFNGQVPFGGEGLRKKIYEQNTQDLGLNRFTEILSGKNPWYDSYEDYYADVKSLSNDKLISYSKIPEFKISDKISKVVNEYSGDITKITLQEYADNFQFSYKELLDTDNKEIVEEDTINIIVDGVKKLLPYNGFYPQDRSLQLVNYLKESYLDTNAIEGGYEGGNEFSNSSYKFSQFCRQNAFLEPFYSPGIFYNLIKSGIAVDWSIYTGSFMDGDLNQIPNFKISFESILNLQNIPIYSNTFYDETFFNKSKLRYEGYYGFNPSIYVNGNYFFYKIKEGSAVYTLSINNFLAETINFFLKDSTINTFISKPDTEFLSFDSNKTYYMDIVLRKNDIIMCEAHSSSLSANFGKMKGRYFGPRTFPVSQSLVDTILASGSFAQTLLDPVYCTYTPPYYYGDSTARISFKPSLTRKYTLDEIFEEMDIEFINTAFIDNSVYPSGSLYSSFAMPLDSSVIIKGQIESRQQATQLENLSENFSNTVRRSLKNLVGTATNSTGIKKWVISPKMEVPVLDFTNQEFVSSTTILSRSFADAYVATVDPLHTPPTASGFGRGMWSGYGEIPEGDKGIFLELRETHPRQLVRVLDPTTRQFVETNTGSLLQACGFQATNDKLSKKIGELADSRDISEAIVIIPYLDNASTGKTIRFGGGFSTLTVNDTVQIEEHNFIKINQNIFNYQKTNVLSNKPAVNLADFSRGVGSIQETSISRMIGLMDKYVLPPNFDFLLNDSVSPFVIYIAEFTSKLDKQDLADIWQGVMPKIAMRAEVEKSVISHKNTQFDFFHGQGLPSDVKFLIFKAKKRAEINYYKMTADSSDDGLFPSIQAGKPPSPYSFNWPYDYCSLVETAKVDIQIDYINKSGSNNT